MLSYTIKFCICIKLLRKDLDENTGIQIPGHSIERFFNDHKQNGGMPIAGETWDTIQNL